MVEGQKGEGGWGGGAEGAQFSNTQNELRFRGNLPVCIYVCLAFLLNIGYRHLTLESLAVSSSCATLWTHILKRRKRWKKKKISHYLVHVR